MTWRINDQQGRSTLPFSSDGAAIWPVDLPKPGSLGGEEGARSGGPCRGRVADHRAVVRRRRFRTKSEPGAALHETEREGRRRCVGWMPDSAMRREAPFTEVQENFLRLKRGS